MSDIFLNSEIKNKFHLESEDSVIPEWISIVDADNSNKNEDSFLNLFKKNIIENDNNDISVNSFNIDVINKNAPNKNSIFLKSNNNINNINNTKNEVTSTFVPSNIGSLSTTSELRETNDITSSFMPTNINIENLSATSVEKQLGGNLSKDSNTLSKKPTQSEIDKFISMLTTESENKESELQKDFDTVTSMTSTSVLEEKLNSINTKQSGGRKSSKKSSKKSTKSTNSVDIGERKLNAALEFWHKLLGEIKEKLGVNHPTAMKVGKLINTKIKEDNPNADHKQIFDLSVKHLQDHASDLKSQFK